MDGSGRSLLEDFLHASPDALIVVDADGMVQAASDAVVDLFGFTPEELRGQPVEVLIPMGTRGRHVGLRDGFVRRPEVRPMGAGLDLMGLRKDGTEFPVDVSLVPSIREGSLSIGAFVRDATVRRRNEDLLRFVNELSHQALAGAAMDDLLQMAARQSRTLIGATTSWIAIPERRDQIIVVAADGHLAEEFFDVSVPFDGSLAGQAMSEQRTVAIDGLSTHPSVLPVARQAGFGAGLYLPMVADRQAIGAMVLARSVGEPPFPAADVGMAEIFASAVAVVMALGAARQAVEDSRVTAEHERIARDLHDTVIQRLFAIGMRLQASERMAEGPVAERISDTVENIDQVIREIRETIFDLNHPDRSGGNVRHMVREVTHEAAAHLGFNPRINFRGPVESALTEDLTAQMIPVLREALANVGRHARASSADVLVSVADGWLTLNVADDGVGISGMPSAGNGMFNMKERAENLDGEFALSGRKPSGTLLQWRVPLGG